MTQSERKAFEAVLTAARMSSRLAEIIRAGFPDLPEWARTFSFVPAAALRELGHRLEVRADSVLLDLACGMGGPGQIVATETGATLVGIDFALPGLTYAVQIARAQPARFDGFYLAASGDAIPVVDQAFDSVLCIDSLRFIPGFGLNEIFRVLRPGGRLGLTLWERPGLDHIDAVLSAAGFEVSQVSRHDEWLDAQEVVYEAALAARDEGETDPGVLNMATEAERALGNLERDRRVMAVASKPAI